MTETIAKSAMMLGEFNKLAEESSSEEESLVELGLSSRMHPLDPILETSLQQESQQLPWNPINAEDSKRSIKHEASSYTRSSTSLLSSDISGYTYPKSPFGSNKHWNKG